MIEKKFGGSELPASSLGAHASLRAPGDGTQTGMAAAEQDVLVQPDRVSLARQSVTQRDSDPGTRLDPSQSANNQHPAQADLSSSYRRA